MMQDHERLALRGSSDSRAAPNRHINMSAWLMPFAQTKYWQESLIFSCQYQHVITNFYYFLPQIFLRSLLYLILFFYLLAE